MLKRRTLHTAASLLLAPAGAAGHQASRASARVKQSSDVLRWEPLVVSVFPPETVEDALSVLACESQGNPSATAGTLGSFADEFSVGLMQINTEDGHHGWLNGWGNSRLALKIEFKGIGTWRDLLDPLNNLEAAAFISRGGTDWSHWTCQP